MRHGRRPVAPLLAALVAACGACPVLALPAAGAARVLGEAEALELVDRGNEELAGLRAEVVGAEAALPVAERLLQENPELELGAGPRRRGGSTTVELGVALSQRVELAGRGERAGAARAGVEEARARFEARRSDLRAEVRTALARAIAARERLSVAGEARELAAAASRAAEERLQAGAAGQLEVNSARVEGARAGREVELARRELATVLAGLRLLLALPAAEELVVQGELGQAETGPPLGLDASLGLARERRADLRAARAAVAAARAAAALADAQGVPGVTVGAAYEREEGADVVLGTFAIPLPVFDRNQRERASAAARLAQAGHALVATERRVEQDVRLQHAQVESARAAAEAFRREALEALRENLALATQSYAAGKLGFLELLVVRRETLEGRRAHVAALEEVAIARAQLARAVGD